MGVIFISKQQEGFERPAMPQVWKRPAQATFSPFEKSRKNPEFYSGSDITFCGLRDLRYLESWEIFDNR